FLLTFYRLLHCCWRRLLRRRLCLCLFLFLFLCLFLLRGFFGNRLLGVTNGWCRLLRLFQFSCGYFCLNLFLQISFGKLFGVYFQSQHFKLCGNASKTLLQRRVFTA